MPDKRQCNWKSSRGIYKHIEAKRGTETSGSYKQMRPRLHTQGLWQCLTPGGVAKLKHQSYQHQSELSILQFCHYTEAGKKEDSIY